MVLPDGTRSEPRRPNANRGVVGIIALLALVGGTLAIGMLTAPDPEPEEVVAATTTTSTTVEELERPLDLENFSVDQITIGEPLKWERAAGVDDLYARQVVQHEGVLYLFGSTQEPWAWVPNPIVVWRSADGRNWESLGTVLEAKGPVHQVASTTQGLIVVESGHAGLTIWRSDDAITWAQEVVPIQEVSDHTVVYPTAVAASSEATVVTGSVQIDVGPLLNERMLAIGSDLDLTKYGWGYHSVEGETRFVVYGPVGIHLVEVTADELGMTPEEVDLLTTGNQPAELIVLVNSEELGWRQATIEEAGWVESLTFDGTRLLAVGHGQMGTGAWVSDDGGLNWEVVEGARGQPWGIVPWDGRLVGMHQGGAVDIVVSEDGLKWERADLDEHFPAGLGWGPSSLAAGKAGVALVAESWSRRISPDPEPALLTRGGATLSLDNVSGQIELEIGHEVHTWRMYSDQSQDGIEVDLETQEISFHDRETGDLLATFTIDEITEAERSYGFAEAENSLQAFAYSPDAEVWTIQDVEEDFGEGTRVMSMAVTDDAVVALVGSWNNLYGTEPGLEIWTGLVP